MMQGLKLSISQLNNYIKSIFDHEEMLIGVSVYGEVSGYKISGGNAYFDIKEEGAQLTCIEFGAKTSINNGDSVIVSGRLNYHTRLGKLSFVASKIEPYGLGELYKKFLELKARLESEGVFSEENKKPIPRFAKCVGVVTSETGAVIHDIINVARSKNPFTDILLYPVKVQGEGAAEDICRGISYLAGVSKVDVIIVARGGGSLEDLAPFNTERVARAVFECNKPIVSGVGHETDFTLCDFASDLRAPTPSVASDLCFFDYYAEVERLRQYSVNNFSRLEERYAREVEKLRGLVSQIVLEQQAKAQESRHSLIDISNKISAAADKMLADKTKQLEILTSNLNAANPMAILSRGFSKVTSQGKPVVSVKNASLGDELTIKLKDGLIYSIVKDIKEVK